MDFRFVSAPSQPQFYLCWCFLFAKRALIKESKQSAAGEEETKPRALFDREHFANLLDQPSAIIHRLQTADRLRDVCKATLFALRAHSYLYCADNRLSVDRLWPHDVIHIFLLLQPLACDVSKSSIVCPVLLQTGLLSVSFSYSLTHTHTTRAQWNTWQGGFVLLYHQQPWRSPSA